MENQNTPLWDASLDINERLDWLLEALNLDEKCRMFSTLTPEVARLGIRSTYLGEEAAHGVEAKHDLSLIHNTRSRRSQNCRSPSSPYQ